MEKLTCYDIMVGDYVMAKKEPIRITTPIGNETVLRQLTIYGYTSDGAKVGPFLETELTPILLTAEILEKSGFKLYKQDFTSRRVYKFGCFDYIEINDYSEDNRYNYFSIGCYKEYEHFGTLQRYIHDVMKIRYVHELQHSMLLCGVDKEIVL